MVTDAREPRSLERMFAGCEALWRDAKYALMRRSYAKVQEMQKALRSSPESPQALGAWIDRLHQSYQDPIPVGADRNALFHVLGYFKKVLPEENRRELDRLIHNDLSAAWKALESVLLEHESEYITMSYVWRMDPWNKVWFRHQKEWYQLRVEARERDLDVQILSLPSFASANSNWPHLTEQELVDERFGVYLANTFVPYRSLWGMVQELI